MLRFYKERPFVRHDVKIDGAKIQKVSVKSFMSLYLKITESCLNVNMNDKAVTPGSGATIEKFLFVEMDSLGTLQDTLQKNTQLTNGMVNILKSFEERLIKLEQTILPVYQETGNLQRRQENIEKTLIALDTVISFHEVAKKVEIVLRDGPSDRLDVYIKTLAMVTNAIEYFEENNPSSTELANLQTLFDNGSDALQREFRTILSKYSKPVPAIVIQDAITLEDEELNRDEEQSNIRHLPDNVIQDLIIISKWFLDNDKVDFINIYSEIRSKVLSATLQNLKDHHKTSSGSSNTLPPLSSPSLTRNKIGRDTPTRKASRKIQLALKKKGAAAIAKYSQSLDSSIFGMKRQVGVMAEPRDDVLDHECDFYITYISSLLKLMQTEHSLMNEIIPKVHAKNTFVRIIQQPLDTVVQEGENLASRARKCVQKHDFSSALMIFPIIKHVTQIQPEFDKFLVGCQSSIKSKIPSIVVTLNTTGAKALEDFIENIRSDPDKQMPKDGTVHQQTSNVMMFLEQLLDFDTVGVLSGGQDSANTQSADNADVNHTLLAKYVVRVLSALALTLENKAEVYNDPFLKAVFRLNNLQYVLKSLQRCGLIEVIGEVQDDIEDYYQDQILDQKRLYSQSWSRVLHFVMEVDKPISQQKTLSSMSQVSVKLKDKERQMIKDKFTGFNKEIEEICRIQKGYAIPDVELRESMKRDNIGFILPKYQLFYDKYVNMPFTKNPEKYLKYKPIRVGELINEFFDAAA